MPSSARFSSWHCTNVILNIEMCKTRRNSKIVTQRSGHHFERSCERYAVRSDEVGEIRLHFGFAKITNRAVVDSPSTLARRWTRRRSRRDSFAFCLRQNNRSRQCLHWRQAQSTGLCRFLIRISPLRKKSRHPRWDAVILAE